MGEAADEFVKKSRRFGEVFDDAETLENPTMGVAVVEEEEEACEEEECRCVCECGGAPSVASSRRVGGEIFVVVVDEDEDR